MNFFKEAKAFYKEEQQHSEEDLRGEEEEEDEEKEARRTTSENSKHILFPCPSSTSPPPLIYRNFLPRRSQEFHPPPHNPHSGSLHFYEELDLMDLSPTNNNNNNSNINKNTVVYCSTVDTSNIIAAIEKEHMFDKVVTPSDVGKLNRLVIPKQHAEKYFPLDASSTERGMLLNFEDRNGKPWRFRYSYWNSSQSYVMTKGWSRFVKEKKLDAGDIVSFQRGVGEESRHRLFIDWRRRPNVIPHNAHFPLFPSHLEVQNNVNSRWGNRLLYSLPHLNNFPPPPQPQFQISNMGSSYNVQHYHSYQFQGRENVGSYNRRPSGGIQFDDVEPVVIDSVPVVPGRTMGKSLRLFGVNVDCSMTPSGGEEVILESHLVGRPSSSTHGLVGGGSSLQLLLPSGSGSSGYGIGGIPMENVQSHEVDKKGKTSLSFDLDL